MASCCWQHGVIQLGRKMGVLLCLSTCSSSQLQRSLRVVLHPILQGAFHVGFGIQQQLQVRMQVSMIDKERETKKKTREQSEGKRKSHLLMSLIWCQDGWFKTAYYFISLKQKCYFWRNKLNRWKSNVWMSIFANFKLSFLFVCFVFLKMHFISPIYSSVVGY